GGGNGRGGGGGGPRNPGASPACGGRPPVAPPRPPASPPRARMSAAAPGSPPPPIAPWRGCVVRLLFLAPMLAYLDRLALNNTQRYLLPEFAPARVDANALAAVGGVAVAAEELDLSRQRNRLYADFQFAFGVSFALFQV